MTQYQFAKEIGYTHGNLSRLEVGKINPSKKLITAICSVYWPGHGYVNKGWLITGKGDMFYKETPPWAAVNDKHGEYAVKCSADDKCREICRICMDLPPDDRDDVLKLLDILTSDDKPTVEAIKKNIHAFKISIDRRPAGGSDTETDFKPRAGKRKKSA